MAEIDKRLEGMRNNPKGDWQIADVKALCDSHGITYKPPNKGSHAKVSHPLVPEILTIPVGRPIKPIYIKKLVTLVDDVLLLKKSEARLKAAQAILADSKRKKGSKEQ